MAKEELYIEAKLDAEQLYADLKKLKSEIEKKKMEVTVNAKLTKDAQQVVQGMNQIADSNKKAAKAAEENTQANTNLNKALESGTQAYNEMTPAMQRQIDLVAQLKQQQKDLAKALKDPTAETEKVRAAWEATSIQLKDAQKELRKMQQPIQEATTWVGKLFQSLKAASAHSITTGLLSTFGAFSLAGGVKKVLQALIRTIKESIQSFISFESAFAGVKKTVEATDYQFDAFNRTLKQMTTYIPMAYEDLAKIAELGGQMGVPIENLAKFTETLAAISVSTNLGLEDAALALSRIASVMGIDYNDVDRLGSAIVQLGNNFAATESEITTFMEKISGTANVVGMTAGDVAGISAALTSVGIASEKGGTAVNKLSIAINDAVNKGGKKLKILAKLTGQTEEEFSKLWKADAGEAFTQVIEGIGAAGQNSTKYIEALVGTGTRMKEVILNISAAGSKLRDAIEMGNDAYRSNIALMEEAAKRYGTTESQLEMLNNQLKLNKTALGEDLVPFYIKLKTALVGLSNTLVSILEWYNKLSEAAKTGTLSAGATALAAALFLLFKPLGIIVGALEGAGILFDRLYKLSNKDSEALTRLRDAMQDTNKELYKVEDEMSQLNDDLRNGKIGVEEYNRKMKELRQTMSDLKDKQDDLAESTAQYQNIQSDIDFMKEGLDKRQEAINEISETIKKQIGVVDGLKDKQEELEQSYKDSGGSMKDYKKEHDNIKKSIDEETDELNKLIKKREDMEESAGKYAEAMAEIEPALQSVIDKYGDVREVIDYWNAIKFDSSYNVEQINQITDAFNTRRNKTIQDIQDVKREAEAFIKTQEEAINGTFGEYLKSQLSDLFGFRRRKAEKTIIEADREAAVLDKLQSSFTKTLTTVRDINAKDLLDVEIDTSSTDQLNQSLADVNSTMQLYGENSEIYIALDKKRAEITEELNKRLEDETETLGNLLDKEASEEEILKQKEKLLKLEAEQRLLYLQGFYDNEKDYAEAALKVDEWLEKAKGDLRKDWYDKEIDSINDIIEKYKELKKEAEKAFSNLADDVKSVSSDISKLVKKIQDLKEDLADLNKDRIKDLGDRYNELQKNLDDIDKKIAKLNDETSERGESGERVYEAWDNIEEAIDKATDNVKDYKSEIEKLAKKIADLEKDTTDKLSDRYAEVVEEIKKINEEMEVYTRYDILTDADAKKKAELQKKINDLLSEQTKITQELSDEQIEKAKERIGETETDKILREARDQKAIYEQEITDYENKIKEQQSILESYRAEQSAMLEKYDWLDTKSSEAKYKEMIKQLEDYSKQREEILKEMDMISQNLTEQEIQDAIIRGKMTETELILQNYYTQKKALEDELADYEDQLKKKLQLLAEYYGDAALLSQKYADVGGTFSDDDLKKIKEAAENLKGVKETVPYTSYQTDMTTQKQLLTEQEDAKKQLETISKNLEKLTDYQLTKFGSETLKSLYEKILQLQLTSTGANVGTGNVTNNSTIQQSFNVNNVNDAAVIASAIRRQIKL